MVEAPGRWMGHLPVADEGVEGECRCGHGEADRLPCVERPKGIAAHELTALRVCSASPRKRKPMIDISACSVGSLLIFTR